MLKGGKERGLQSRRRRSLRGGEGGIGHSGFGKGSRRSGGAQGHRPPFSKILEDKKDKSEKDHEKEKIPESKSFFAPVGIPGESEAAEEQSP